MPILKYQGMQLPIFTKISKFDICFRPLGQTEGQTDTISLKASKTTNEYFEYSELHMSCTILYLALIVVHTNLYIFIYEPHMAYVMLVNCFVILLLLRSITEIQMKINAIDTLHAPFTIYHRLICHSVTYIHVCTQ